MGEELLPWLKVAHLEQYCKCTIVAQCSLTVQTVP